MTLSLFFSPKLAGSILANRTTIDQRRADKANNDHPPHNLLVPIPT